MGVQDRVSNAEWDARVELAACFRLVDYYGMSDLTGTHCSARVPGDEEYFLMNAHGIFFDEVTASNLAKVRISDGEVVEGEIAKVNPAGYTIHSAIHEARPDALCAVHTHTRAGMAVSAMSCGLLPISQHSMEYYNRISYHEYEGVAVNPDEKPRLVADLGENNAMILRNHGLLVLGRTISEAFQLIFRLEKCCQSQVDVMASGADIHLISEEVRTSTSQMMENRGNNIGDRSWPGHLRRLDRLDPSYKD